MCCVSESPDFYVPEYSNFLSSRAVFGLNGVSSAQIGLLLTDIVGITSFLSIMVRQTAEVEVSLEIAVPSESFD